MLGNDSLMTEGQVAEAIRMSKAWLRKKRYAQDGIPSIKVGRAVRYRVKDVMAWVDLMAAGAV